MANLLHDCRFLRLCMDFQADFRKLIKKKLSLQPYQVSCEYDLQKFTHFFMPFNMSRPSSVVGQLICNKKAVSSVRILAFA